MVHHFRHDEYMHIKPVLIICAIIIFLIAGGAVAIYYATKQTDIDFSEFYRNTENKAIKDADDSNDPNDQPNNCFSTKPTGIVGGSD